MVCSSTVYRIQLALKARSNATNQVHRPKVKRKLPGVVRLDRSRNRLTCVR